MMGIFSIKFVGLKKNRAKSMFDCSEEFTYFSGSQTTFIKSEEKREQKKMFYFKIGLLKFKLTNDLKPIRKEEATKDLVLNKKRCPAKENIYVSLSQLDREDRIKVKSKDIECDKCIMNFMMVLTCNVNINKIILIYIEIY
jgi:hypothetical protein